MAKPPLRAVQDGEKPPAPKKRAPRKAAPRTMAHAAKLSRKTMLETMRDKLAAAIDDPRAHPRDIANLMKQLDDVLLKLDALKPQKAAPAAPQTAVASTPNESWNADAI
ncbi:terminase small subunit [Mycobacterium phage Avocado]|uniref:Terminase small subunit n=1 Tax=Mycobacterium phage Avocado TaxID=2024302 RepID=A0A222YZ59_9CAUD|nr:terminase small subunit [Mycobacterium phage Avocado]ASR77203.1 terminase small subunit [Mycobacterium phage Avocado]